LEVGVQKLIPGTFIDDNFEVTYGLGEVIINPAALTVTVKDTSRIYGDVNPAFTTTISGFAADDDSTGITMPQVVTAATAASPVGTYALTLSGGTASNYSFTYVNGSITIKPAQLLLKADDVTKVYGTANPQLSFTATGFVNGDGLSSITAPQISTTATTASGVGTYPISLTGGSAANYTLSLQDGTFTITPATLTISANNVLRYYGDNNPLLTMSANGFVNGDDISSIILPQISTNANNSSLPGNYAIVLSGGSAANYQLTLLNGILQIRKAPLTITADDKTINQGSALPVFTSTIGGLKNGDVISGISYSASTVNTSVAGTYTNMPSVNINAYPQYDITFVAGILYVKAYTAPLYKIIVTRQCVRKLTPAVNGNGYEVVFSYENPNSASMFIPKGTNNAITIENGGTFENSIPETFLPGYHEFTVKFSGQKMYWSVTSVGSTHRTANAAANNASNSCVPSPVARNIVAEPTDRTEGISVYPNPAKDVINIAMSAKQIKAGDIVMLDALGKLQPVKIIHTYSSLVSLDIASLPAGTYLLRVSSQEEILTIKFIKQ
jgi:hypothetical protein